MSQPGELFHRQGSPSRPELHGGQDLPQRPSPFPFEPLVSRTAPVRCNLPEGWLPSHPAVQCRQDTRTSAAVGKEKTTHAVPPGGSLQPAGQPTSLQTVLSKIRLSFISYLSCGFHRAAGYEGHLIRPCTALWCEKALQRFDSPLLRSRKLLAIIDIGFPC